MVRHFGGPADGAKVNRIVAADLVFPVVRQHLTVALKVVAAGKIEMVELQRESKTASSGIEHTDAFRHDLLAYAVTGDHGNAVGFVHG